MEIKRIKNVLIGRRKKWRNRLSAQRAKDLEEKGCKQQTELLKKP
jgi:hypothetical protein